MQFLGKFGKIIGWPPPGSWRPLLGEILDPPLIMTDRKTDTTYSERLRGTETTDRQTEADRLTGRDRQTYIHTNSHLLSGDIFGALQGARAPEVELTSGSAGYGVRVPLEEPRDVKQDRADENHDDRCLGSSDA